jgi:hypothetical protein
MAIDKIQRDTQQMRTWPFDAGILAKLTAIIILELTAIVIARMIAIVLHLG